MYTLATPLEAVKGIGSVLLAAFHRLNIFTVLDLLLELPIGYEDRSTRTLLKKAEPNTVYTFVVKVTSASQSYRGRRSMQRASIVDESGRCSAMWFNNKFIMSKLVKGETYLFSGKINDRGVLIQPAVEAISKQAIHTDRIIPLYSTRFKIKIGVLRRLFAHMLENLVVNPQDDVLHVLDSTIYPLKTTLAQLHFPDSEETVVAGRQRLAIEELLALIQHSHQLKQKWHKLQSESGGLSFGAPAIHPKVELIPESIPFTLTKAQTTAISQIVKDLGGDEGAEENTEAKNSQKTVNSKIQPMNRLLVGDVGSGKTAVAGTAAFHTLVQGFNAALVAPTQILAHQHAETLKKLFPNLPIALVTGKTNELRAKSKKQSSSKKSENKSDSSATDPQPTLYVGTHAILNVLPKINPALLIFDEQHRFGVVHRSIPELELTHVPHILTMTATPIPRSYMLTVFDHLSLSTLDEMPVGRKVTKTWLPPQEKRQDAYAWIARQSLEAAKHVADNQPSQVIQVCPFIDESETQSLSHVAAATTKFAEITAFLAKDFPNLRVGLLHSKLSKSAKEAVTQDLYSGKINWLVTTPIVEVGLDLPRADTIIIEAAERFGLASLHQLRGRVGRAGQQGYCVLFTSKPEHEIKERLTYFCSESSGFTLAEYDLKHRGGGDIFGTQQHGLSGLRFADWADMESIAKARKVFDLELKTLPAWKPLIKIEPNIDETSEKWVAAN